MAWLYRQKGSAKWWIGYRADGRQFLRSTGTSDRAEAQRKLEEIKAIFQARRADRLTEEVFEHLTGRQLPKSTLPQAAKDWLEEVEASTAATTLTKYQGVVDEFLKHVGATTSAPLLREVTTQQIRDFLFDKRTRAAASTVNVHRKILGMFFRSALSNGLIKVSPMLPIKLFAAGKDEKIPRRAFTLQEVSLIYSKAPNPFWRYMVMSGFYTGLRMGDLICLRWGSVDFSENLLRLTPGKTARAGRTVQIPLAAALRQMLDELNRAGGKKKPADYLWPKQALRYANGAGSFSSEFYDEVLTRCGLVPPRLNKRKAKQGRAAKRDCLDVSFHCLRHTFISLLRVTGGNQAVAKELAGHSSDLISDQYTHLPKEVLSEAIKRLPELGS